MRIRRPADWARGCTEKRIRGGLRKTAAQTEATRRAPAASAIMPVPEDCMSFGMIKYRVSSSNSII